MRSPILAALLVTSQLAASAPLGFAPLDYFNQTCARCHGRAGSLFDDSFNGSIEDKQLQATIGLMVAEHGAGALKPAEMNALVGLHRAWLDRKPYISLTKQENGKLTGEIWSAKPARLRAGERTAITIDPATNTWEYLLDKESAMPALTASDADSSSTLDLAKAAHTHAVPRVAKPAKAPTSASELQGLFKRR